MTLDLHASIRGVDFWGYDHMGFVVASDEFSGWEDGPNPRGNDVPLVSAHGSFDVPTYLEARQIQFGGVCRTKSREELALKKSLLTGLLADGDKARLEVDFQGENLWTNVRLAPGSQTRFASLGQADDGTWFGRFQISFKAANPRKFGETTPFTALANTNVDVMHWGNFPATPVVVVEGNSPAGPTYAVEAQGRRFHVSAPLVPGHPHTLDFASGHLIIDGAVTARGVIEADAWAVPGGQKVTHYLNMPAGYGQMTVFMTDTYV